MNQNPNNRPYDEDTHILRDEDTKIINNGPDSNYGERSGYDHPYGNGFGQPPRKSGSPSKPVIIGVIAGLVVCGIIWLVVYLVGQNRKMAEMERQLEESRQKEAVEAKPAYEAASEAAVDETPAADYYDGPLNSGSNVFHGYFNYAGSSYGFTVRFNYDPSTNRASGGTYDPDDYNGRKKLSGVSVSDDGRKLVITGNSTYIEVASDGGDTYSGFMRRGDHQGSCSMTLR